MEDQLTTKSGTTFFFKKGITDKQIDQLIQYAQSDKTVQQFTSDVHRFSSRESFDQWKKADAVFYTLTDKADNLKGIIWFEELEFPEIADQKNNQINDIDPNIYHTTFAIRLYDDARGQGLSIPFIQKAIEDFKPQGLWLATSPDNAPAVSAYKNVGFKEIGMKKDGQKLIMILL